MKKALKIHKRIDIDEIVENYKWVKAHSTKEQWEEFNKEINLILKKLYYQLKAARGKLGLGIDHNFKEANPEFWGKTSKDLL